MHKTCQPFHLSVFLQVEVCPTSQTYQEVQRSTHSQLIQIKFQQNQPPRKNQTSCNPSQAQKRPLFSCAYFEVHFDSWWLGDKQILHLWTRFTVPRHSAPGPRWPQVLLPALHAKQSGFPLWSLVFPLD